MGDGGSPFDRGRRCVLGRCRLAYGGSGGRVGGEHRPTPNRAKRRPDRSRAERRRPSQN